jgi:hypothetical protein
MSVTAVTGLAIAISAKEPWQDPNGDKQQAQVLKISRNVSKHFMTPISDKQCSLPCLSTSP